MSERLKRTYSDLVRRLAADPLASGDEVARPEAQPKRRRIRKPSLVSVAKQAAKAGLEVARYEVDPDGKIIVVTGKPDVPKPDNENEWDSVLQ